MPAHCISSSVHWNGTRSGLPLFSSGADGPDSVLPGSALGDALPGAATGSCAHTAHVKSRAAVTQRFMLSTILAQRVTRSARANRQRPLARNRIETWPSLGTDAVTDQNCTICAFLGHAGQ